jgi:two-component system, sensor histidine kinase and response regulator
VLMNLLSNAVKFTAEGEVVVRAVQQRRGEDSVVIRLEVSDTGIGMEESVLRRIFDAFSQADETTTRRFGGTGLGLAICKSLVELMGGEIGVNSQPTVGSTFWCVIPFRIAPALATPPASSLAGLRVVVATPFCALADTVVERLAAAGATAVPVMSTAELVAIVRDRDDYQVLIIDADRLSRVGTWQSALALPTKARVARIFLNRQPRSSDVAASVIRPRDLYLSKPVSWRSLQQAILKSTSADSTVTATSASDRAAGDSASVGRHVLIVEDNPVNQLVAEGMLRKLGYAVTCVADGRSAVTRLSNERYDAVLMDCQMPIMDGLTTTRLIRGLPEASAAVPIIGLTADASGEARTACLAAGMDDYLSKPYMLEELRVVLLRHAPPLHQVGNAKGGERF